MIAQPFTCAIKVSETAMRVAGLDRQWPKRVHRYLAPLDFSQEADQILQQLLTTFDEMPRAIALR